MSTAAVKPPTTRAELLAALNEAARRQSTATVLFHAAVAERLGLSATDHKYADLIARQGPMTAGERSSPRTCDRWRDRKSTRLNSSHGYISYAVFCLKK